MNMVTSLGRSMTDLWESWEAEIEKEPKLSNSSDTMGHTTDDDWLSFRDMERDMEREVREAQATMSLHPLKGRFHDKGRNTE